MKHRIESLLSYCSEIDFGDVSLSDGETDFRRVLDNEVISLCKSLPQSTQANALLFFMKYFRIPFGKEFSIFTKYYVPAWSTIYWLMKLRPEGKPLTTIVEQNAKTAHSMALILHPLDDHLNDGQLEATHLILLLRSQAWMIMTHALRCLADEIHEGPEIVAGFLDDYYSSVKHSDGIGSLDTYCDLFRKQMATWLIVPVLVAKALGSDAQFSEAIQSAYESFGIAWRLLDDINDIQIDMKKGARSAVYTCLPDHIKSYWDDANEDNKKAYSNDVLNHIQENSVLNILIARMCTELEFAASIADKHRMPELAHEFRRLNSFSKTAQIYHDRNR
jgi:hypothetical protein